MQITSNSSHSSHPDIPDENLSLVGDEKCAGNQRRWHGEQQIPTFPTNRCHSANDSSIAPRPVEFGPSAQGNKIDKQHSPAGHSDGREANSPEALMKMMQMMLTDLMQLMSKILSSFQDSGTGQTGQHSVGNSGYGGESPFKILTNNPVSSAAGTNTSVNNASPANKSADTSMPGLPPQLQQFSQEYTNAAKETGVPASTLAALTWTESRGNVDATSTNPGNGETDGGINQINPDTYKAIQQKYPNLLSADANNPNNQIMASALLLRDYQQQFGGNMDAALRAYNSGPNQVNLNNLSNVTIGNPNYINEVNSTAKIIASGNGMVPA